MQTLKARVDEVVFRNPDNGFTVLSIRPDIGDGPPGLARGRVSAVGSLPALTVGESITFTGEWQDHAQYGKQFRVTSCEWNKPETVDALERTLASGWIKGVGPRTAKQIVQAFGMDAMDVLRFAPEKLEQLPGMGRKRARLIAESFHEQHDTREAMVFLQGFGIPPKLSMRIFKVYGEKSTAVIRQNPYRLVEDVPGVGFKTADAIALSMGLAMESPFRVTAGVTHTLRAASLSDGHCYLPKDEMESRARELLGVAEESLSHSISELIINRRIILKDLPAHTAVYLRGFYDAEAEVASRLTGLRDSKPRFTVEDEETRLLRIEQFERKVHTSLDETQREAVLCALRSCVCVVTGGPGTGKTTIIRCILDQIAGEGNFALAAPTGRAAKRMTEATGNEAKTIHRLLEYGGDGENEQLTFARDEKDPLDVATLVVDESSMIDLFLARALLRAVKPGTRVVFVGDADQLPPVGPGNVLRDMLDSGAFPVTKLTRVYRQSEHSMIAVNARDINEGRAPRVNERLSDFFLERQDSAAAAAETLVDLHSRRLPAFMKLDGDPTRSIQALSPMKKGECGVWALNKLLQAKLNPPDKGKPEFTRGDTLFRLGDKVTQTRNNYQLEWERGNEEGQGVFNGDMGYIESIDEEDRSLSARFDDDRLAFYDTAQLDDLELGYCISVHKSQGSEFPAILMPVVGGPPMLLTRNLLYTAVTRAKRLVVLVGKESALASMVRNYRVEKRYSALARRIGEGW
ncbi:MAG: ATP-dependent RecD-like DNA helicase [Oscillospiraceae bacterium]|jgi:exodeoxyribonuclease V alpha subunit|nr:ATP-dependent RecD-like DNA helicase [Oscillospiraceae bacterium]